MLGLMVLSSGCPAQDKATKAPDPNAFSTRVYRLSANELTTGFVSRAGGNLQASPLPPPSANASEPESFLKRSHQVVKDYLARQSITLPKGSLRPQA